MALSLGMLLITGHWPRGSRWDGLLMGVIGFALIVFELLLWVKRRLRGSPRWGTALWWMKAHIWLGLLILPLVLVHSSFRWGGPLTFVLMLLFWAVWLSGVLGLVVQQIVPKLRTRHVQSETVDLQIDEVVVQLRKEARQVLASRCAASEVMAVGAEHPGSDWVRPFHLDEDAHDVPADSVLLPFFSEYIDPFLQSPVWAKELASPARAANLFHELRQKTEPDDHEAVDILEALCDQRRQLILQRRLHRWLHLWLVVHVPLSLAMFAVLIVHVWTALAYW